MHVFGALAEECMTDARILLDLKIFARFGERLMCARTVFGAYIRIVLAIDKK